ncbi:nucleoside 2-deoxyribosyltransferase [Solidesulfovibrio carbinolicus]|uniref:Nucleoside 2-deoxyribosyltransferase n=1 Tax=Solidesulfovibrio carbinolicus TaxID=296842 RepID=A0A4P6I3K8_9BACT|nr:nucleoside 2-deoxyribosyltransferase [Solidesulfovibrio carbinolicus]QAZ68479.1 nucleoside 2-deoxyribosyltransferase [Solidesulfovibrio carbinolicus]
MRVYLAGPLFTLAERRFMAHLRDLAGELPGVEPVWPGDLFTDEEVAALGNNAKSRLFAGCRDALESCDLIVAVLDGPGVDDGTAWELGYAHARGLPAWGLRTDCRNAGETASSLVNCMIECACQAIHRDLGALLAALARQASRGAGA